MNLKQYEVESSRTMSPIIHISAIEIDTLHGIIGVSTEHSQMRLDK